MSSLAALTKAALKPQRLLDLFEQVAVLGLYVWLVARLWPADFSGAHWYSLVLLASEGLVVALLLLRRPTERISHKTWDWAVAMGGTFLALLVGPGGAPVSAGAGMVLMLAGLAVQFGAKLSLWRSFGVVAANRGVKTVGLYRFVRHPMYAGYVLTHAGFLLVGWSWWNLAVYLAVWSLLVLRIMAEEKTLKQDPVYAEYATRVRWRVLPGVY